MTPTANQRILLQTDLGLLHPTPEQEVQLDHYLSMAHAAILREGVRLDPDAPEDDALLSMYAAWIYRRRASPDPSGMPRMIRAEPNDRTIAPAGGTA